MNLKVTKQSETGLNTKFVNIDTGRHVSLDHAIQQINIGSMGHEKYDFVDVVINDNNELFIDPYLIECSNNGWCNEAGKIMFSFFNCLFSAYRHHNTKLIKLLLSHAGEQNGTKLGYGRGDNGKGNTAEVFDYSTENIIFLPDDVEEGMFKLLKAPIRYSEFEHAISDIRMPYDICFKDWTENEYSSNECNARKFVDKFINAYNLIADKQGYDYMMGIPD